MCVRLCGRGDAFVQVGSQSDAEAVTGLHRQNIGRRWVPSVLGDAMAGSVLGPCDRVVCCVVVCVLCVFSSFLHGQPLAGPVLWKYPKFLQLSLQMHWSVRAFAGLLPPCCFDAIVWAFTEYPYLPDGSTRSVLQLKGVPFEAHRVS